MLIGVSGGSKSAAKWDNLLDHGTLSFTGVHPRCRQTVVNWLYFTPTYSSFAPAVSPCLQVLLCPNLRLSFRKRPRLAPDCRIEVHRVLLRRSRVSLNIRFPYSRAHLYAPPQDVGLIFSARVGLSAVLRPHAGGSMQDAGYGLRRTPPSTHSGE